MKDDSFYVGMKTVFLIAFFIVILLLFGLIISLNGLDWLKNIFGVTLEFRK